MAHKYNPFRKIKHNWNYANSVIYDTGKKFVVRQSKGRNVASPKGSGVPIGSKFKWKFMGRQRVKKVRGGYQVTLTGTKKLMRHNLR